MTSEAGHDAVDAGDGPVQNEIEQAAGLSLDLAELLLAEKRPLEARRWAENAGRSARTCSDASSSYHLQGRIAIELAETGRALFLYQCAIQADPSNLEAREDQIWALRAAAPESDAVARAIRRALVEFPAHARFHLLQAVYLNDIERPVEARKALDRAGDLTDDAALHVERARSAFKCGHWEETAFEARTAMDRTVDPQTLALSLYYLAVALGEMERFEEAISALSSIIAQPDLSHCAQFEMARIERKRGRPDRALDALRQLLQINPEDAEARDLFAQILIKNQGQEERLYQLSTSPAAELSSPLTSVVEILAGHLSTGMDEAEAAVERTPSDARAWAALGVACRASGETERARAAHALARLISPDNDVVHWLAGLPAEPEPE